MYYTRTTAKRIKINNDIEDANPIWVSAHAGRQYDHWLTMMNIRYPQFCIRTHMWHNKQLQAWYRQAVAMSDEYCFDGDQLKKLYPDVYTQWIKVEHQILETKADAKKLNWIYEQVRDNPLQFNGSLP